MEGWRAEGCEGEETSGEMRRRRMEEEEEEG